MVIFGTGNQTRDFVNVKDVAEANYEAGMAQGICGVFNIASGKNITINELSFLMAEASGIRTETIYADTRKGDVADSLADISAAQKAFAYEPKVKLDEGLKEYLDWADYDSKR